MDNPPLDAEIDTSVFEGFGVNIIQIIWMQEPGNIYAIVCLALGSGWTHIAVRSSLTHIRL